MQTHISENLRMRINMCVRMCDHKHINFMTIICGKSKKSFSVLFVLMTYHTHTTHTYTYYLSKHTTAPQIANKNKTHNNNK